MVAQIEKTRKVDRPVATTRSEEVTQRSEVADFEKLLSDLSAALVRVPVAEIDNEIELWLQRIVLAMDVDRGNVLQVDPVDGRIYVTHQWGRPGVFTPDRGLKTDSIKWYPWLLTKLLSGELVVFSSFAELPPEASQDVATARRMGAKSNATIPLKVGGAVVGALLVGTVFSERTWSNESIRRLTLLAEMLGNALERIRSEAQIRRLSEELRQVSQVVSMGELTASLAHELNQPLGAILNNTKAIQHLLKAKTPDLTEIEAALDDIVRDDARAVEIVRNVRAMFKRGEAKMSPVDIKEVLLDVARIVSSDARMKGIVFSMELPDSLPPIRGDKTHLSQVILNLIFNAFDSVCESDGSRTVTVRAAADESGQLHVAVGDTGRGIDPAAVPNLFKPFFTTKSTGMGMGLTIASSIIQNHGGRLWATQNPGRGATVEFALPIENNTEQAG